LSRKHVQPAEGLDQGYRPSFPSKGFAKSKFLKLNGFSRRSLPTSGK